MKRKIHFKTLTLSLTIALAAVCFGCRESEFFTDTTPPIPPMESEFISFTTVGDQLSTRTQKNNEINDTTIYSRPLQIAISTFNC